MADAPSTNQHVGQDVSQPVGEAYMPPGIWPTLPAELRPRVPAPEQLAVQKAPPGQQAPRIEGAQMSDSHKLELVAAVLDLIPDFFYVHDYEMRFWYANQQAADYFGAPSKEDLIGRRLIDVDPSKDQAERFVEVCQRIMREGVPRLTDRLPFIHKHTGATGFLRQHDIPFRHPTTGEPMLIGLSRDVTSEVELEAERRRRWTLERDMEIARTIQAKLRPPMFQQQMALEARGPANLGVELHAVCEPAAFAGGDFYDWFTTTDGRVCVFIGDVTGHGVGPAILASECRAFARVLLDSLPLDEAVRRLDDLIARDLAEGRFVTFAAAVTEPDGSDAQVFSAGHGPILVRTRTGELRSLPTQAGPLGLGLDMTEPALDLGLDPGDGLLMLSDGVFESASPSGERFGLERLYQHIRTTDLSSGQQFIDQTMQAVRTFAGGRPADDDITLVVARRVE